MTCVYTKAEHVLRPIFVALAATGPGIEHVVRWCYGCGAVVVDVDVDGRTQPGGYQTMAFPRIALDAAGGSRHG